MEFVAFVLCMTIIAQINAAPTPQSASSVPHKDNEFELPPISRGGFQMILDVTIDGKYDDTVKGKSLKVVMLPNENEKSEIQSKFCPYNGDGMHICILPFDETLLNRAGESQTTTIKVQVTALRNADDLHLEVDVEENNVGDGTIPLKEFEKLKHFSVGGIAGNIQRSGTNYEGGYGTQTQLNGGSESVPLRPVRSTERNMFVIPRALNIGDSLVASCNLNNRNRFTANLLTGSPRADYNNVACQLDADLQNGEITLGIVKNGEQDPDPIKTSGGMISGTDITLDLKFQGGNGSAVLIVSLNQSEVDMVQLRHDIGEITFLEVAGANVTELCFKFAE